MHYRGIFVMTDQSSPKFLGDVPLENIIPNDYNPNIMSELQYTALLFEIQEFGCRSPILVRKNAGGMPPYMIIDGYHRWKAAKEAGKTTIPCYEQ